MIYSLRARLLFGFVAMVLCMPQAFAADVIWMGGWYGPMVVEPRFMIVDENYYDFSVGGLQDLCIGSPELCNNAALQNDLSSLNTNRILGNSLLFTGIAASIAGSVLLAVATCNPWNGSCDANATVGAGLLFGGIGLDIAGLIVRPSKRDVMHVINQINNAHPENPIRLQASLQPNQQGVHIATNF